MIGFVTLGTNDVMRAARFYDAVLAPLGAVRALEIDGFASWAMPGVEPALLGGSAPALAVIAPFDGGPATVGNGVMAAIAVERDELVDRLHALAIENGAHDEGEPGPRGDGSFYGAYFRDLDGNKLCVFRVKR